MPFRTGPFPPAVPVPSDRLAVAAVATPAAEGSTVLHVLETARGRWTAYGNQRDVPVSSTSTAPGAPSRRRIRFPGCHGARA